MIPTSGGGSVRRSALLVSFSRTSDGAGSMERARSSPSATRTKTRRASGRYSWSQAKIAALMSAFGFSRRREAAAERFVPSSWRHCGRSVKQGSNAFNFGSNQRTSGPRAWRSGLASRPKASSGRTSSARVSGATWCSTRFCQATSRRSIRQSHLLGRTAGTSGAAAVRARRIGEMRFGGLVRGPTRWPLGSRGSAPQPRPA